MNDGPLVVRLERAGCPQAQRVARCVLKRVLGPVARVKVHEGSRECCKEVQGGEDVVLLDVKVHNETEEKSRRKNKSSLVRVVEVRLRWAAMPRRLGKFRRNNFGVDVVALVVDIEELAHFNNEHWESGRAVLAPGRRAALCAEEMRARLEVARGVVVAKGCDNLERAKEVTVFHFGDRFRNWDFVSDFSPPADVCVVVWKSKEDGNAVGCVAEDIPFRQEYRKIRFPLQSADCCMLLERETRDMRPFDHYRRRDTYSSLNKILFLLQKDEILPVSDWCRYFEVLPSFRDAMLDARRVRFLSREFTEKRFVLALCLRRIVGPTFYRIVCDAVLFRFAQCEGAKPIFCLRPSSETCHRCFKTGVHFRAIEGAFRIQLSMMDRYPAFYTALFDGIKFCSSENGGFQCSNTLVLFDLIARVVDFLLLPIHFPLLSLMLPFMKKDEPISCGCSCGSLDCWSCR